MSQQDQILHDLMKHSRGISGLQNFQAGAFGGPPMPGQWTSMQGHPQANYHPTKNEPDKPDVHTQREHDLCCVIEALGERIEALEARLDLIDPP